MIASVFRAMAETVLFRPWLYLLLALALAAYGMHRRDKLVVGLTCSGLLYEASYFFGAAGAPYRYSHWLVTCACLSFAIAIGTALRDRGDRST